MAAKKKKPGRPTAAPRRNPNIMEIFTLVLEATQQRDEMLKEVQALQAAGKRREARELFERARHVTERIEALQEEVRPKNPHNL